MLLANFSQRKTLLKGDSVPKYLRLTEGLSDKGRFIQPHELKHYIRNWDKDFYTSMFYYDDKHVVEFSKTNTVSGMTDVVTDKLILDFDSKDNLELAKSDVLKMTQKFKELGIKQENVDLCYSGQKGLTVTIQLDKWITPDQAKDIAINKLGPGLDTLDPVIYNASRVIRVPGTKHQISGLYKTSITFEDLKQRPMSEIREMAKKTLNRGFPVLKPFTLPPEFLVKSEPKIDVITATTDFDITKIDFKHKPPYLDNARWLLVNGYFREGERSNALLCLAATYKNVGYDQEVVYRLLKGVAQNQAKRTGEKRFPDSELYKTIVSQVYGPNWRGGQFTTKDPNNWLSQYARKMGVLDTSGTGPMTIADVEGGFLDFVNHIDENTIKTGIASFDKSMPITIGMNVGIIGASASGKTSWALEVLRNTSKNGVISVFASLDMHRIRLFEKLLYKVSEGKLSRKEIYDIYRNGKGAELTKKMKEEYQNVWFYDRSAATVDGIRDYILEVEQKTGEKVKLVMIDYFERVISDMSDDTAASKQVACALQDLVNDLNICLITLVQPNKQSLANDPSNPILSYTAIKGSSFLYQSFRGIASIWRPFLTPGTKDLDKYLQMGILKNDLGELEVFDFKWDGKTGSITEMEDFERAELHKLLKEKKEMENEREGW